MERVDKKYSIQEVLSKTIFERVPKDKTKVEFDGDLISMNSDRYRTFSIYGIKCCFCGIEGQYFYKERHLPNDPYHFNLYALNKKGKEVLMTKDHIISKWEGGPDHIDNYRTMCSICNWQRGKDLQEDPQVTIHRITGHCKKMIFENLILEKYGSKWTIKNESGNLLGRTLGWVENRLDQAKLTNDVNYLNQVRLTFHFALKLMEKEFNRSQRK